MKIQSTIVFTEEYIPPRCRKPRRRKNSAQVCVTVPECTKNDAPVAIREEGSIYSEKEWTDYRWYKGHLFTRERRGESGFLSVDNLERDLARYTSYHYDSKGTVRRKYLAKAHQYLIIDGNEVWSKAGEPRYVIATFGLGHNHASTDLMTDHHYNPNIPMSSYYNALQREEAISACKKVAMDRGDTNSIADIGKFWRIEVLIPEAVKVKPNSYTEKTGGNDFLNTCESFIQKSGSANEAAVMVFAAALAGI